MLRHFDWDDNRNRTLDTDLPQAIDSIEIALDGGRVKISINDQVLFHEVGEGTRDCLIRMDRISAPPHDWATTHLPDPPSG